MSGYLALPFTANDPSKVSYLLDRLVEHDAWWSDFQKGRREIAAGILAKGVSGEYALWEVWNEAQVVGLVAFTDVVPEVDCKFHPIFFDGQMSNALGKRGLLLNLMSWAFRTLPVERISAEIPEFQGALIRYARKKLGFRFEAEGRTIQMEYRATRRRVETRDTTPTAGQAVVGSRKFRIVRYKGTWHDLILLSVTHEEFTQFVTPKPLETADGGILPAASAATGSSR